jgi:hypothetical protein
MYRPHLSLLMCRYTPSKQTRCTAQLFEHALIVVYNTSESTGHILNFVRPSRKHSVTLVFIHLASLFN